MASTKVTAAEVAPVGAPARSIHTPVSVIDPTKVKMDERPTVPPNTPARESGSVADAMKRVGVERVVEAPVAPQPPAPPQAPAKGGKK